jgi:hypothetical protein
MLKKIICAIVLITRTITELIGACCNSQSALNITLRRRKASTGTGSTRHLPPPSSVAQRKRWNLEAAAARSHPDPAFLLALSGVTLTRPARRRSTARPARICWRRRRRPAPEPPPARRRAGARHRRRRGGPRWGRAGATPPSSWRRTACAGTGSSSCAIGPYTHAWTHPHATPTISSVCNLLARPAGIICWLTVINRARTLLRLILLLVTIRSSSRALHARWVIDGRHIDSIKTI